MAKTQYDPEFFDEAGSVLSSPYWQAPVGLSDVRRHVQAVEERDREHYLLLKAIQTCHDYSDLRGEAKAIYDRARAAILEAGKNETP